MPQSLCVYGLTGGPVHLGHRDSYLWLKAQDFNTIVVPAIGHEFKPESVATYLQRRTMCELEFGNAVYPVEEEVLRMKPLPIMAIDVLELVRSRARIISLLPYPASLPDIFFAVGPDVDLERWTGIEKIRAGGFKFVQLPEILGIRSSLIRANIAEGKLWEHMVSPKVAAYIKLQKMYGWRAPS